MSNREKLIEAQLKLNSFQATHESDYSPAEFDDLQNLKKTVRELSIVVGREVISLLPLMAKTTPHRYNRVVNLEIDREVLDRFLITFESGLSDDDHLVMAAGDVLLAKCFKALVEIRNGLKN